jgi:type VI secretion system ImpM family protein
VSFLSHFRKRSADDPPPTESWPLFAFGKLPVYKDFISAGLTDDVAREFRDWLSNGFSRHWSSRDDCRSTEIPLHAFLVRLPESRKMAAGALWGSTDQGGLRKFPFALFTILPAGKPVASVLTALDYLPVFESRAREIRRKYDAAGSLAAVYQELRGARIEIPVRAEEHIRARLAEALGRSRVGPLATALFGNDARAQWAALLSGLDAAARRPGAGAAAFRVPLEVETAPLDQMKLWTVRLMRLSTTGAGPSGVLYRIGGEVPSGVFLFRDVRAEDILLLHSAAIPTDFVEEIPPPARTAAGPAEAAPEPAALKPATSEPAAIEPAAVGAAPIHVPEPPAELALPPKTAPPPETPPAGEIFLLGAAAGIADARPAGPPTEAPREVAPEAPAVSGSPSMPEPAPVREPPSVPPVAEPPSVPEPTPPEPTPVAGPPSASGPSPVSGPPAAEAPAARASPPGPSPPGLLPRAEPADWDLPLASLLEAR